MTIPNCAAIYRPDDFGFILNSPESLWIAIAVIIVFNVHLHFFQAWNFSFGWDGLFPKCYQ